LRDQKDKTIKKRKGEKNHFHPYSRLGIDVFIDSLNGKNRKPKKKGSQNLPKNVGDSVRGKENIR